jgi:hypothetical protein
VTRLGAEAQPGSPTIIELGAHLRQRLSIVLLPFAVTQASNTLLTGLPRI